MNIQGRSLFKLRIIIVDHFEKIKSIKEDERIILWGHNYFG